MIENCWHNTQTRVRYKDTDRMGVVYYGNYLTFFEIGRAEYMRALGYPYAELEGEGIALAVIEAYAKYHGNVGYDELITVRTSVTEIGRVKLRFDYEIYSEDNTLLVTGFTVHACINNDKKPSRIPQVLTDALKGHEKIDNPDK